MASDAPTVQIVSLGAGLDTTYWNIRGHTARSFKYIEVDFKSVFDRKLDIIASHPELAVEGSRHDDLFLSPQYCFVACDMRDSAKLAAQLKAVCDLTVPTLFIVECVFVYIERPCVDAILQVVGLFEHCALVSYDMINPHDAFGRMMIENLLTRDIHLPGLLTCPSLETQVSRFRQVFPSVEALTMLDVYRTAVDPAERQRIERLEWLDELEEWEMISSHYCMVLGAKGLTMTFN
jgi:hypothetical protein